MCLARRKEKMLASNDRYSDGDLDRIWNNATKDSNTNDVKGFRKDACGAWIKRSDYGSRSTRTNYGWEVDHIKPKSLGGTDDISNLRPLHWMNNVAKNNSYQGWHPAVTSRGNRNVEI